MVHPPIFDKLVCKAHFSNFLTQARTGYMIVMFDKIYGFTTATFKKIA